LQSTLTDGTGHYGFAGLAAGTYVVEFVAAGPGARGAGKPVARPT
jgi:hypothetical protein